MESSKVLTDHYSKSRFYAGAEAVKKLEFERFLMKFFADFKFHLRLKRPTCRLGGGGILEDAKISQKAFWISIFLQPRRLAKMPFSWLIFIPK